MAYAAKEALFKALGTGKVGRMTWGDIEVGWPQGAAGPSMALSGETAAAAARLGVTRVHVTAATTREHAVAVVITEGKRRETPFRLHAGERRCLSTTSVCARR
jgi:holo-[acyl-carrier protein] synthase